jgi:hypothetical protein
MIFVLQILFCFAGPWNSQSVCLTKELIVLKLPFVFVVVFVLPFVYKTFLKNLLFIQDVFD